MAPGRDVRFARLYNEGMRILFLDVASHHGLIAAVDADTIVASLSVDHRIDDREFTPAIESVLKQAKWKQEDVTHIACIAGPGGFTSIRVGVSAANALSWALSIPSCAIHLSDVYEARFKTQDASGKRSCVWVHSTKKTHIFLRGFGEYKNLAPEAELMKLQDAVIAIPDGTPLIGELIPEHQAAMEERGLRFAALQSIEEVLPSFLGDQAYAKQTILPWYGRGI